jgi:tetratricopeptide (TPR) repeat protein
MSGLLQWFLLTAITGSPVLSAAILIFFWFFLDRFTLGLLPDPVRWVKRWQRELHLKRVLQSNPHDRQARRELGELLVRRRAHAQAVEMVKPMLEAGDDDPAAVFTMGVACLGAGHHEQGEKLLAHVAEAKPDFRVGEVDFALGRARLKKGDFKGAREAFERAVKLRHGTVEGRVLLAKSLTGLGDEPGAALMRDAAWNEYVLAPRFVRRQERLWAWRARPSRPLAYLAVVVVAVLLLVRVAAASDWNSASPPAWSQPYDE